MGGDLAPKATLEGAIAAARDFGIEVVLVGDRELLARELSDYDARGLPITIEHAAESVAMDESPVESVLAKPASSIHVGLDLVKHGKVDGFVSAGNSGAVMAAAMATLGNLPGVDRPAIASTVPTTSGLSLLIDAGANTEVKPLNLVQFAVMGCVYWRQVHGVAHPRVGILSNGEEASKGTELTRAAATALLQMGVHVNYIGYVEGRDINRAKADVVVTDGFTGNVALKTMEGFAAFLLGNLRDVFSVGLGRIAYLLIRKRLGAIRERLDPAEYGGAPLLGLNGVAIIAHGSSSPRAIRNAIRAAANEALVERVNAEIVETLARHTTAVPVKSANKGFRALLDKMRERLHRHPREAAPPAQAPAAGAAAASPRTAGTEPAAGSTAQPLASAKPAGAPPAVPSPAGAPSLKTAPLEHPPLEPSALSNGVATRQSAPPSDSHPADKGQAAEKIGEPSPHKSERS